MQDSIFIENLTVYTTIGLYDYEQQFKQPLLFSLVVWTDLSQATTDQIDSTISYADLATAINNYCQVNEGYQLLETMANGLADYLATQFAIKKLSLTINKPHAIPHVEAVGININRSYT